MDKAKVYLFTSPTCPSCPPAKQFMQRFRQQRDDFDYAEFSTSTHEGSKKAEHYDVMAVPTFIIKGPGYPGNIGLRGLQSEAVMNKYLDVALGKRRLEDSDSGATERKAERKPLELKIGKLKIRF